MMLNKMEDRIQLLKTRGFDPQVILDIGAHKGAWTNMIQGIFPKAKFYLFEADPQHKQLLTNKGYDFEIVLLGDKDNQTAKFYRTLTTPYTTGNSIFRENTRHYQDGSVQIVELPMKKLDSIMEDRGISKVDFMKLDVQGAELLILDGAQETLKKAEVVLLETSLLEWNKGAPKFAEVVKYMDEKGFEVIDIAELHYLKQTLLFQLDVLFVKKESNLIPTGMLS